MFDPSTTFERWFVQPLAKLHEIPNGDGAFIALATSCFLYERYAVAVIKGSGGKADRQAKIAQFMADFTTNQATARAFWDVIRDGILHQAMPKQSGYDGKSLPVWQFHHSFKQPVELGTDPRGLSILKIEPWLFTKKVIDLWRQNLDLLDQNASFPWGNIGPILLTQSDNQK